MTDYKFIAKIVGACASSALLGCLGTYIYMKKVVVPKAIDEGIADYILHRYDGSNENEDDAIEESEEGKIKRLDRKNRSDIYSKDSFYNKKDPQDILAEREHPTDDDEEDDIGEYENDEAYMEGLNNSLEHKAYIEGRLPRIELIDEREYDHNPDFYSSVLFYWLGDDIVSDGDEEVLEKEEVEHVCGDALSDEWKDKASENPLEMHLYFRNREIMKEFMVIPIADAYWSRH